MARRGRLDRALWWLLFRGDRLVVATGILLGIFAVNVVFGVTRLFLLTNPARLMWMMNGVVNGILTLVTVVVAVNQLILSQEFGGVRNQKRQLEAVVEFREEVEEQIDPLVSPPETPAFLRELFLALADRVRSLERKCKGSDVREEMEAYVRLFDRLNDQIARLDDPRADLFVVLAVILDYNDSIQQYETRRFRAKHDDALSDATERILDDIQSLLVQLDTARQYFKMIFIQRELARLSRYILYTGVLSIVVSGLTIMSYRSLPTTPLGYDALVVVVSLVVTVVLSPVAVLVSFILRVATVARRTAAFGYFVPEPSGR
ncbi:hypothetical protein [Haladaptatus salinisoli]|uniref:hypothetical protein n=1 Tax=Haladaptatus salinisoli TaxID=2884876 RepID=UPI001D0BD137|nr:hypothetical protein [Haladaptatus salinisoli]